MSAAVTPRGGTDCDDPCRLSWYFCFERFTALGSPADGRENASPSFEIERGAAFMESGNTSRIACHTFALI